MGQTVSPRGFFHFFASFLLATCFFAGASWAQSCGPQWLPGTGRPDSLSYLTNDYVQVTANWDPDGPGPLPSMMVVAGSFNTAGGTAVSGIALWDGNDWQAFDDGFNLLSGATGGVYSLAAMPNGDLIAGGSFDKSGNMDLHRLARWNGTAWEPFGQGNNASVIWAMLVMPNGDLIVGGYFTNIGGVNANNIARWDGTNWYPLGTGVNASVKALALSPNGDLMVGGGFWIAGGQSAHRVARWDGTNWFPLDTGLGSSHDNTDVTDFVIMPNGDLVAGGTFLHLGNETPANRVARWNGTSWSALGAGINRGFMRCLASLPNGDLVVGGDFDQAGGVPVNHIARWDGTSWSQLGEGIVDPAPLRSIVVSLLLLPDGDLIAVDQFQGVNISTLGNRIARWDGVTWSPLAPLWGRGMDKPVFGISKLSGGRGVVAGGDFFHAGETESVRLATWNGLDWVPLGPEVNGHITSVLALSNGDVIAGGTFDHAGDVAVNNIARWDGAQWYPLGNGVAGNSGVFAAEVTALLEMPNGDIIAGGTFTRAGDGLIANHIARWDGSNWSTLGSGVRGAQVITSVFDLALLQDGSIVAGGLFAVAGSVSVGSIARWDGTTWSGLGTGLDYPGFLALVSSMVVMPDGRLIAAGLFNTAGENSAYSVASWDGNEWQQVGGGFSGVVQAMTLMPTPNGPQIVAGGGIRAYDNPDARNIARFDGTAWQPLPTGPTGTVLTIAANANGELLIGGQFRRVDGRVSDYFARWSDTGAPWVSVQPEPQSIEPGEVLTLRASPPSGYSNVTYRWQRNGVDVLNGLGGASFGGGNVSGASGALPTPTQIEQVTLQIVGAQASDAGNYQVIFENSCGNGTSNSVAVEIGRPCRADYNSDGVVNFGDFFAFLDDFFVGKADFNQDGRCNSQDYFDFLIVFFNGC